VRCRFVPPSGQNEGADERASIGLEELLLRHALNLPGSDWMRERQASGVMMIPVPSSGILGASLKGKKLRAQFLELPN